MMIGSDEMEKLEDISFYGVNIKKVVEGKLTEIRDRCTKDMTQSEKTIYDMAIFNALSVLQFVTDTDSNETVLFNANECDIEEEFTLDDIANRIWFHTR